jgi:biotin transport system substrate-specific component
MADNQVKYIVLSSLFSACMAIGSYIIIPFVPVPIVLSNFFVLLAALLLGSKWGCISVGIYLLCGVAGLPVFSRGSAGIAHLLGPTGGYLFGYLPAVLAGGYISQKGKYSLLKSTAGAVAAAFLIYGAGVPWLKIQSGMTWGNALLAGMVPFLLPDGIKIAAAVAARHTLHPWWDNFIKTGTG